MSDQLAGLSGTKLLANAPAAATNIPTYSQDDLQQIFKAVLEIWAPAPASIPAPSVSEVPRKKLKDCFPDVYRRKSHMDYFNFYQQYEDYFATTRAMEPTRILFTASFFQDRISFC